MRVAHGHGIAVNEIEGQHKGCGAVCLIRIVRQAKILGEYLQHIRPTFGDIVRQKLDAVAAHQRKQRVVPLLESRLAEFSFHSSQLALQDRDQKVPAAAGWLQEAGIDPLGLALDEVKHLFNEPRRGKDLSMIRNALFGFY